MFITVVNLYVNKITSVKILRNFFILVIRVYVQEIVYSPV